MGFFRPDSLNLLRTDMRILFWGTPAFALPTLEALASAGHTIAGVVTRPDRPRGRGRRVQSAPVYVASRTMGFPVLTPEHPRGEEFVRALAVLKPDISIVVAYGRFLPREVLDLPPLGSLNLHPSLLPELRGAAPINRAIERGYRVTGVSIMRMVEAMDAGPVLARQSIEIDPGDTASGLSVLLAVKGAQLMTRLLARLEEGPVEEIEQNHAVATFAPPITRDEARIRWDADAHTIANAIRAMDAVPGAWTTWERGTVKLFRAVPVEEDRGHEGGAGAGRDSASPAHSLPGQVLVADSRRGLHIATGDGVLRIGEAQPSGGRRMAATDWLRGYRIAPGDLFGAAP